MEWSLDSRSIKALQPSKSTPGVLESCGTTVETDVRRRAGKRPRSRPTVGAALIRPKISDKLSSLNEDLPVRIK